MVINAAMADIVLADTATTLFILFFVGLGLYVFGRIFILGPGFVMQQKFSGLAPLAGKTEQEIVTRCGVPRSRTPMADGTYLLQWAQAGYSMGLVFDGNGTCLGLSNEYSHIGVHAQPPSPRLSVPPASIDDLVKQAKRDGSRVDALHRLRELRKEGLLTEAQFQAEAAQLLDS
jgi:hypothetical protein